MKRVFGTRATTAVAAIIAAGAGVALAIFGVFGAHGAVPRTGPLNVHAGLKSPPGAFVRGDGFYTEKEDDRNSTRRSQVR